MGKVRRVRQKYHLPATKAAPAGDEPMQETESSIPETVPPIPETQMTVPDNLFSGTEILFDNLKTSLKDSDAISVISSKTDKSRSSFPSITKKEKRKLRRELFLKKLEVAHQQRKVKEKGKKKSKQVVKALADELPAVNLDMQLESSKKKDKERHIKFRSIPKAKHRKMMMMQDIDVFKKLLSDPDFKVDPVQAASSRVQERVYKEVENET